MRILQTQVFQYDELSPKAQAVARAWWLESGLWYDWWESTYEDAANVGLKLTAFDLDRNRHAEGRFERDAQEVAWKILADHGKDCETFKTATQFLSDYMATEVLIDDYGSREEDEKRQELANEFLKSLLEDYSIMLQRECEWLQADEQVAENIKANEYEFTEDGRRC